MKTVNCEGVEYLAHEAEGNAARWIMPLAQYYCKGEGLDIGCARKEWAFPGAFMVDPEINEHHAMGFPFNVKGWDYLFSSHMLEHLQGNWMTCLDYWLSALKVGGILFLYLPHASQNYWQPRNNRKHIHVFRGDEIDAYLTELGHQVFVSGVDANHSFTVICEKKEQEPKFGTQAYYNKKAKVFADDLEEALIKQGRTYFRDGDNVVFNGPNPLDMDKEPIIKCGDGKTKWSDLHFEEKEKSQKPTFDFNLTENKMDDKPKIANRDIHGNILYGVPDAHGDMLMPGCFDKSKLKPDNILWSHLNMTDEEHADALKMGEQMRKDFTEATPKKQAGWYQVNKEQLDDLTNQIAEMRITSEHICAVNSQTSIKGFYTCKICNESFIIRDSKYSDRLNEPKPGDQVTCPNCYTFYTLDNLLYPYKPNIFNTKSIKI